MEWLFLLKDILENRLTELFPEPSASFGKALLFGSRDTLPWDMKEDFRKTGLTHIVAISGYNIILIIGFVFSFFSFLPRKISTIITLVTIALFTIFVGASASVVRAAIMGSLGLIGRYFGRPVQSLRTLFLTAIIMIAMHPRIIFEDIGFQLSFGATLGIVLFSKRIEESILLIPNEGIRNLLATTWAAQIFTTPLILFHFQSFAVLATITNLILLPFIPFLMLGFFLSLIFGKIIAAPTWLLTKLFFAVTHFFAKLPFSFMDFGNS